uniref:wall-associated receptor kinase 2-like n=1 Tax=Erigeron canadensis TaxID=72917 RepID=UPI001CB93A38|nr:wall-associated receptor kinase 2-like [Erigeron canadensis]
MAAGNGGTVFAGTAKQGCQRQCGDITVPFPFGIAKGDDTSCSLSKSFSLTCSTTSSDDGTAPELSLGSNVIHNISDSELRIRTWSIGVAYRCYHTNGSLYRSWSAWSMLEDDRFTLSEKNKLTVIGCDDYALITGRSLKAPTLEDDFSSGCITSCINNQSGIAKDGKCSGKGCCQISIPKGLRDCEVELDTLRNNTQEVRSFNPCSFAFLGEQDTFEFHGESDIKDFYELYSRINDNVLVVVDWVVEPNKSCSSEVTECKGMYSECYNVDKEGDGGYRCRCKQGYQGNPYLEHDLGGCQDIDECADPGTYPCYGVCNNTLGSYSCTCPPGSVGNATKENGCVCSPEYIRNATSGCEPAAVPRSNKPVYILGFGLALPLMVIGLLGLYFTALEWKLAKLREKYYERNGGALLKEKLTTRGGVDVSSMYIFRVQELKKATDNFADSKVIGKGGNGTVYQGTLTDERVVAIKKSQRVDEGQREEFINEMVILTQINHTHVVQLIGFCLETEVPLLVYEFVSNGTLHRHIHNNVRTGTKRLSWDTRLRIAHESAGALAYLHTDTRMSIIHRDVKSTNILLDENCTAKIADFGASRLVPLGHDEVTTLVQGTLGYLDPEYFHTGHLTDRSDVYSFGVVLAELLTGQQPLSIEKCPEERNLATNFLKAVKENKLLDILEDGVVKEAGYEQLKAISILVCRCLNQVGGNRPGMKEVTMELDALRKSGKPTNLVSEDNYDETSCSHMIDMEQTDPDTLPPMPTSDTIGDSF